MLQEELMAFVENESLIEKSITETKYTAPTFY